MGAFQGSFKVCLEVHGVVISAVISRVTILITHVEGLITRLITTHEPPSRVPLRGPSLVVERLGPGLGVWGLGLRV